MRLGIFDLQIIMIIIVIVNTEFVHPGCYREVTPNVERSGHGIECVAVECNLPNP